MDDFAVAHAGKAAAIGFGHRRVPHRESADIALVDNGIGPRNLHVRGGVRDWVADDRQRYCHRIVLGADSLRPVSPQTVIKYLAGPVEGAVQHSRVWVEHDLGRVTAQARCRLPGTMHTKAVALACATARDEAVPDTVDAVRQIEADLVAPAIEQAQLNTLRDATPDCEIGAVTPQRRTAAVGLSRCYFHQVSEMGSRCQMSSL